MSNIKTRLAAAAASLILALVGAVTLAAPSQAATCTLTLGKSFTYDYAWITDTADCWGFMGVRHYYYPGGPGTWTIWVTGSQHHYESNHNAELASAEYVY
jgi:hypothetical protein